MISTPTPVIATAPVDTPKIGVWRGAMHLLRASWSIFKVSPEIIWLQGLSAGISLLLTAFIAGGAWWASGIRSFEELEMWVQGASWAYLIPIVLYWVMVMVIGNFFLGAIVSAVLARFSGAQPTVAWSLSQAWKKATPLFYYSLFASTVAIVISIIHYIIEESRLSVAGKFIGHFLTAFAEASVNLVSVFAIPVIMTSEDSVWPIETVKRSARLFAKVWGQELSGGIGLGLIFLLVFLPMLAVSAIVAGYLSFEYGKQTLNITLPIFFIIFLTSSFVLNTLNTIFHVALFQFALTGQSPAQFDSNVLKAAFKPKKKWFV